MLTTCWALCCLTELTLAGVDPIRSKYYRDLQLMQGEWELVAMEGLPERHKALFMRMRLTVKGKTMIDRVGKGSLEQRSECGFILRPELSPKGIDYNPDHRDLPLILGIYEVTEHILIILEHADIGGERPKDFSLPDTEDHNYRLMVYRRVK